MVLVGYYSICGLPPLDKQSLGSNTRNVTRTCRFNIVALRFGQAWGPILHPSKDQLPKTLPSKYVSRNWGKLFHSVLQAVVDNHQPNYLGL